MNPANDAAAEAGNESSVADTVANIVAHHPFLQGLKPAHLLLLADSAMRVHYQPDESIFREGDPANRFYLIEKGRVSLESQRKDQAGGPIQVIGPGDVLGWSWLFPPYYWHFGARALEPTTAIFFYGTRLRDQCEHDHEFGYEMMWRMTQIVSLRLQAARQELLDARRIAPDGKGR